MSFKEIERGTKNMNRQYQNETRIFHEKSEVGASFSSKWFGYQVMSFLRNKKNLSTGSRITIW